MPVSFAEKTRRASRPEGTGSARRQRPTRRKAPASGTVKLPGWDALAAGAVEPEAGAARTAGLFDRVSTGRFALLVLAFAAAVLLYVGHVQATQATLGELQSLRRDNLRLHLKYNRLKGEFDHATGPTVIYERARALGLEEGIVYGPAITVER